MKNPPPFQMPPPRPLEEREIIEFHRRRNRYDPLYSDPGYEGRGCERHGAEGDTVIGKACIIDKGINDKGEHTCDVALWAENLDGDILQTCPSQIVLPSRNG